MTGRVAIVTGGASGIGRAIAGRLLRDGMAVAIPDLDVGRALELEQGGFSDRVLCIEADVRKAADMRRAVEATVQRFGRLDAAICNAGILGTPDFLISTEDEIERVVDTNLMGSIWLCRYALEAMTRLGGGSLVLISSISALRGSPAFPAYAAAKAALLGLTKSLARQYGRYNVRVNCLCPGSVQGTSLSNHVRAGISTSERTLQMLAQRRDIPSGRTLNPEDVAAWVSFLCGADSRSANGAVMVVDGGEMLGPGGNSA